MDKKMHLHLGSGSKRLPGLFNIDSNAQCNPDLVATIDDLSAFEDNTVESIYACHVLEHAHRGAVQGILEEWHRALRPGGVLRVAVPDFEEIILLYVDQGVHLERLWGLLYGGGKSTWDDHQVVFDYETLCTLLQRAGFHSLHKYDSRTWLKGIFKDGRLGDYIDFSTAVINAQLISLNILAVAK